MNPPTSQPSQSTQTVRVVSGASASFHTHPAVAITGDTDVLLPDRLGRLSRRVTDCGSEDARESGWWSANNTAANTPATSFWVGRTIWDGIDTVTGYFAVQEAYELVPPYRIYRRNLNVITWSSWEQIDRSFYDTRYRLVSDIDFQQDAQSGDVTPNGTANSALTGLSITVTSPGTSAIYAVEIDTDVTFTGAQTNIVELLVDGVAESEQIISGAGATGYRLPGHKKWHITGLAAGSRAFTAQTRNSAAGTAATVKAGNTVMTVERMS